MFYSHTFLARKGPLGTVWCAAHLQHKLKKSHYTSTDISTTVERIMFPEVPIALRMSGHLLLGVVRIYSKKVDYLYQDCNIVLVGIKKAFSTAEFTFPADANNAPFHTVTFPGTFDLDAMDLDYDFDIDGFQDNHLRSQEEITLKDQILAEYVAFTFDEDVPPDLSHEEDPVGSGPCPIGEDSLPSNFQDPGGPSNHTGGINERPNEEYIPENELIRNPVHDFPSGSVPLRSDRGDERLEPDRVVEAQIMGDKDMLTPATAVEEMSVPRAQSIPSQQHQELPPTASDYGRDYFDAGDRTPDFGVDPSPPVEQQQPEARPKRRKQQLFDKAVVLTNEFVKQTLANTSDILRPKRNCPCSALGVWKLNKKLKKDKLFFDPIITGLSAELCNTFTEDLISSKPHLISSEPAQPTELSVAPTSAPINDFDMEPERIRLYEGSSVLPDIMPSSIKGDAFTPAPGTSGTGVEPTPDPGADTGPLGSDMETPMTFSEERPGFDNTGLSDIPEMADSAEGELSFLEDDNTPTEVQGTPEVDFSLRKENRTPEINSLSVRTRAVAQFLIRKSSATPITDDQSGELSLDNILEGKRRKVAARMFYETLVLKSCGLVDLEQQEPYGDITLKLTPKLSKEYFSA